MLVSHAFICNKYYTLLITPTFLSSNTDNYDQINTHRHLLEARNLCKSAMVSQARVQRLPVRDVTYNVPTMYYVPTS